MQPPLSHCHATFSAVSDTYNIGPSIAGQCLLALPQLPTSNFGLTYSFHQPTLESA